MVIFFHTIWMGALNERLSNLLRHSSPVIACSAYPLYLKIKRGRLIYALQVKLLEIANSFWPWELLMMLPELLLEFKNYADFFLSSLESFSTLQALPSHSKMSVLWLMHWVRILSTKIPTSREPFEINERKTPNNIYRKHQGEIWVRVSRKPFEENKCSPRYVVSISTI